MILLAWELGGGLGHLMCLRTLGRAIQAAGMECVLAVPAGTDCGLLGGQFHVYQVPPIPVQPTARPVRARSMADVLGRVGFATTDALATRTRIWRDLFDSHRPEAVLCEFSPFVCFAAKGILPTISVGTGYTTPPSGLKTFPVLNPSVSASFGDDALLETMRNVATSLGIRPVPETVVVATSADQQLVRCYQAFDPYREHRTDQVLGPLQTIGRLDRNADIDWPNRLYAYLSKDYPNIESVIDGLVRANVEGIVYIHAPTEAIIGQLSRSRLRLLDRVPAWSELLPQVSLVVHHASLGATQACASAGIPQLVAPLHLEHELTGLSILRLGIGAALVSPYRTEDVVRGIERLISGASYRKAATQYAERLSADPANDFVQSVVDACTRISNPDFPAAERSTANVDRDY